MCFYSKSDSADTPVQCLFDLFIPLSAKTYTFEIICGRVASQNALEKYDSVADVPQTVEQTSRDSLGGMRGSGNKAHVLALNTAHVLRLNKADVLALNKAHVVRLNNKICPVFRAKYVFFLLCVLYLFAATTFA